MAQSFCTTSVFLQDACLKHQFIRSKDTSTVVERPERLRAINIGIAAFSARLEAFLQPTNNVDGGTDPILNAGPHRGEAEDDLITALSKLNIDSSNQFGSPSFPIQIHRSRATLNLLNHAAVKYVHGDIAGDVYLESLIKWTKESRARIASDGTEIPDGLSQGDLYLCPTSVTAIQGALATVCEAVDTLMKALRGNLNEGLGQIPSIPTAFVAVRPPGHHCGENTPSGFCFVNNVVVGAAHAHLTHGINRVVIFDIDLHHGNGTQSLIWQINEETYRQQLEASSGAPHNPGLQFFYGSLHDVQSYPCEDGKPELVQAASVSIHGPHGQYVENVHLLPYDSEEQFWTELYDQRYAALLSRADAFIRETSVAGQETDDVLVFISCGFDASEHEHASMSRHGRRVPVGFYRRFTSDARAFATRVARGRLISVLEGGYSDRALSSGAIAHAAGLVGLDQATCDQWWAAENLATLEKATKKRKGGRVSAAHDPLPEPWVRRAQEILATIDSNPPAVQPIAPPRSMALRDRPKGTKLGITKKENVAIKAEMQASVAPETPIKSSDEGVGTTAIVVPLSEKKKLPRVMLKLGPATLPAEPAA